VIDTKKKKKKTILFNIVVVNTWSAINKRKEFSA